MSDNPFLIPPPPDGAPKSRPEPATDEAAPAESPDDRQTFITLPPGIVDSVTQRLDNRQTARPPAVPPAEEIVFFPVVPRDPVIEATPGDGPTWNLELPGGERVTVTESVFIGRNPAATSDRAGARLLPVADPAKSLSKTHALLEIEHGTMWVHDLNSTNGVHVTTQGGDAVRVSPGARVAMPTGAELELGACVIRVTRS